MVRRVYTLDEVAEQLRIKPSWLRARCEGREVPFVMLSGYRFTDEHVDQIIALREVKPQERRPRQPAPPRPGSREGSVTRLEPKVPPRLRRAGA